MLKNKILMTLVTVLGILVIISGMSFGEDGVTSEYPEIWDEPMPLASEEGVNEFNQSPMLDEEVKEGKLPPVKNRLPEDPPVSYPLNSIGEYGGTHRTFTQDLSMCNEVVGFHYEYPMITNPEVSGVLPNIIKDLDFSEDGKVATLYLRKGLKWSDGEEFDAEDIMYWWDGHANNEDLSPLPPAKWYPVSLEDVEAIDDYTVEFHSPEPMPFMKEFLAISNWWFTATPKHYLKQFHPDYTDDKEELKEKVEEYGFDEWYQLYAQAQNPLSNDFTRPTLAQYIPEERTENHITFVRNPYYWKVDPDGNQLPYIDRLRIEKISSGEMARSQAVTGQTTYTAYPFLRPSEMPLYKQEEEKGDFKTLTWKDGAASHGAVHLNMTHKDSEWRELHQNFKFRKAISLAINRSEINNKIFFDTAEPKQAVVPPDSKYYPGKEISKLYTEYNPEEAKNILDEIGFVDQDGDGWRDLPNGDPYNPTIEVKDWSEIISLTEFVVSYLQDIGIDASMKQISDGLMSERIPANEVDMSLAQEDMVGTTHAMLFPDHTVPSRCIGWGRTNWPKWANWVATDGDEGEKPIPAAMELVNLWEDILLEMDEEKRIEMGKKIMESTAENLWTIGTVGHKVQPVIADKYLQNIIEKAWTLTDNRRITNYHPETWYFEDGTSSLER